MPFDVIRETAGRIRFGNASLEGNPYPDNFQQLPLLESRWRRIVLFDNWCSFFLNYYPATLGRHAEGRGRWNYREVVYFDAA